MVSDAERMARAGEYVLGRMSDSERERAERDLETDERFRAAVVTVAERMRYFGSGGGNPARRAAREEMWSGLADRLAALPHMRGTDLSRPPLPVLHGQAEGRKSPGCLAQGVKPAFWRRALRAFSRVFRSRYRRAGAPCAAAVLEAAGVGPCAIVEVHAKGRLRLLLIGEWALGPNEQLSLWGLREDGAMERIGGCGQGGQAWLGTAPQAVHTRFLLGREAATFMPSANMSGSPLAEGAVKALAGTIGAGRRGGAAQPLAATAR